MPNIGPVELIIVLAIALLVVGPRRLPEMGNAVGKTIREFRRASSGITEPYAPEPDKASDRGTIDASSAETSENGPTTATAVVADRRADD